MAPQFVKPYVKPTRTTRRMQAICEAVTRPSMRFVPIKPPEQQAVLALHRARQGFVKAKTAQANQIRGLLTEYGLVIPQGIGQIAKRLPVVLEDGENALPEVFRALLQRLGEHLKTLNRQVEELDEQIQRWHREQAASRKLAAIPGIGPLTASALVATLGDARQFENGRQLAAWLGLVPKQHSSGGKPTLLGIGKARRYLFADAAHSRCARGHPRRQAPIESCGKLARSVAPSTKPKCGGGGLANKNARRSGRCSRTTASSNRTTPRRRSGCSRTLH